MNIYWIWKDKPEPAHCSFTVGKFGEGLERETVRQLASSEPLVRDWPGLELNDCTFEYDKKKRPPADYVRVGSSFFVASDRLRALFESHGVGAEYFPVDVTDPDITVEQNYWFVHILKGYEASDILDQERSKYTYNEKLGAARAKNIVIAENKAPSTQLFTLKGLWRVIAHDKLKHAVEAAGITGVYFLDPYDYEEKSPPLYGKHVELAIEGFKNERLDFPAVVSPPGKLQAEDAAAAMKPVNDTLLSKEEREEVEHAVEDGLRLLGMAAEATPDTLQQAICDRVSALRARIPLLSGDELIDHALTLGCLWGHAVCEQLGWEWTFIAMEEDKPVDGLYAVVPPDRRYAIYPMQSMQKLLSDPTRDQNSLLLYNMLMADDLPASEPNSYRTLN